MVALAAMMRALRLVLLGLVSAPISGLVFGGCAVNPATGRTDFVLVSAEKEKSIGDHAAARIAAQTGFYDRDGLEAYVQAVGQRLAAHSPRQDVTYTFRIIDVEEPNALALPGGHVYVTRGLLVLVSSEDELAGVVGHEIAHVAARHAVQQMSRSAPFGILTGITSGLAGLASPVLGSLVGGAGQVASGLVLAPYSRDQEREADRIGQQLAAESGWDPAAMSTFLHTLQRDEQLRGASASGFAFLASHPATPERVSTTESYAAALHRADEAPLSPTRAAFLHRLDGLPTGADVANGYFAGRTYVHPDFDFLVAFPEGWRLRNSPAAAMAGAPEGNAAIAVSLATTGDDPLDGARKLAETAGEGLLQQTQVATIGSLPAARVQARSTGPRGDLGADITWIAYRGNIFQITGICGAEELTALQRPFGQTRDSFRPLTPDERAAVRENRIRLVEPRPGESADDVAARSHSTWSADMLAVANGVASSAALPSPVKVSIAEPYP